MFVRLNSALVLGLSLFTAAAAHATTVSGTTSFSDTTNNNSLAVAGTFDGANCSTNCSFSESLMLNGSSVTVSNFLTVFTNLNGYGSETDNISVGFNITNPASGSGTVSGTGTEGETFVWFVGFVNSSSVSWTNPTAISLSNGDTLHVTLASTNLSSGGGCDCGNYDDCGNVAATFSLTAPVSAATPEPGSLALLGTGMASVAGMVRRRLNR